MYKKFYGLSRNPFEISPNPYFFYPTPRHNEALASLTYGVHSRKGFVVVTGEVGTGKTLLIRFLLDALNQSDIAFAYLHNPNLPVLDFLANVLNDLDVPFAEKTKSEMLSRLNDYLVDRSSHGGTTALIVDEAQQLNGELLEEIRLLTNLETSQHKLLQIVLVGQPELDQKLDSPQLRQLKQRISFRCRLDPLELKEMRGYIHRRLELAGANSHASTIFPEETIETIHKYSNGIPRLANTLCEHCLLTGYSRQTRQITADIVDEVAATFHLNGISAQAGPSSSEIDPRQKLKEVLRQMIKELDRGPEKGISVASWAPEVRAE